MPDAEKTKEKPEKLPKLREKQRAKKVMEKDLAIDTHGFLKAPSDWSRDWIDAHLEEQGIEEYSEDHAAIVDTIRAYHQEYGEIPTAAELSRRSGHKIQSIHRLFRYGPHGACKMAGMRRDEGLKDGRLPRDKKDRMISKAKYRAEEWEEVDGD